MMQENYLNYLTSVCKKFSDNRVFDIILYGSAAKGKEKPRDIDLLLVFVNNNLRERLEIAQNFKSFLKTKIPNIDVKTANLQDFFDSSFLARQGILIEGYSLLHKTKISERLGFESFSIFTYNLKNLNHNEKTKFTYSLIGRNKKGILKELNSLSLGKGAVMIPIERSIVFEDFLKKWKINYSKRDILAT